MFNITPVVRNLLIANVAIYFISTSLPFIDQYFAFFNPVLPGTEELINPNFKIWQPFTYMFLHGSMGHLFSNMFGLFIFGASLESFMGSKKFLIYYIITGIGASLLYAAINTYDMSNLMVDSQPYMTLALTPMVGASGAIFGILAAYGILFPNTEILILPIPFPIKAKYYVILYGLYETYSGIHGLSAGIAHFAHVGGLVVGYILLKFFGFDKQRNSWY